MKKMIKREQRPNLFEALPSASILRAAKKKLTGVIPLQKDMIQKIWLIMRLTAFFTFVLLMQVTASVYSQQTRFNLKLEDASLEQVFRTIQEQSDFTFFYKTDQIPSVKKVSVNYENTRIEDILERILQGTNLGFYILDHDIVITPRSGANERLSQQVIKITGKITNSDGEPLPGVTVAIKGTTQGTITDADGNYSLSGVQANATLVFSFVGMKAQEVKVEGKTTIHVVLQEETIGIEEVVAIGYGTQKKRDMIGNVASLTSDDIAKTAPVSIESALQGMAAGVRVNDSEGGVPGGSQSILIRGIKSINSGSNPLWIIDGIPVLSSSVSPEFDGEYGQSTLAMFNPNDVESIQVLKDAAATSIYGSRGTNGVILVTTKKGKTGRPKVDIDIKTGFSNWAKSDIGYANNTEHIAIMDLAFQNSGLDQYNVPNIIAALDGATETMTREEALATNTNWVDEISQTGSFYEANASVSQGSDKGNSYLSLRYRKDDGNLKWSQLETFSANTDLNYNLLNCFDLGYRLFASHTDNDRLKSGAGKSGSGGWSQVNQNSLPWMKVRDPEGLNGYWNSLASVNALASMDPINAQSNLKTVNIISLLKGIWHLPVKGLSLKGEFGLNYVSNRARSWRSEALLVNGAEAEEKKYETTIKNYNAYINYDVPINKDHVLNLVTGIENTREHNHTMYLKGENLVGIYPEVGSPNTLSGSTSFGGESYLRGFFGRANYKLFDRYLAEASVRRDGISKFTEEHRWATFLSGALGWIISEEKFFHIKPVSLLKLRGSFGQTGNTNVPSNVSTDVWRVNTNPNETLEGNSNTTLGSIGNSDIQWETTSSLDVGIDFGLFDNRVNGSVAYYHQKVSDMILKVSLPPSAGIGDEANYSYQNIGDMKNYGIECDIRVILMNKKDFTWSAGLNIFTNKNEVLALDPESDMNGVGILNEDSDGVIRTITKTGYAVSTFYMAEYAGVDTQKGIPMIYEVESLEDGSTKHTGNIIPATVENISNNRMIFDGKTDLPKVVGGFNTSVTYKNFDFSMVWSFQTGSYGYNRVLQSAMLPNAGMLVAKKKLLTDSWTQPGDDAWWPQVVAGNLYYYDSEGNPTSIGVSYGSDNETPSSQYLEKLDFLKLRNITLGYTLPNQLTNKYKINNARIYWVANNLLCFTKFSGYDPESGGAFKSMPASRVFMFGLHFNF